ncbi:cytochrome P450 [Gigaspora rosea]|uniref:Cytochrome P450 n=1 Tax=Gigaspora rosea TaxID=44941 RepID=A0A397V7C0_9GLOM|nr:cytochrome P450 [Gigaspora rosea]
MMKLDRFLKETFRLNSDILGMPRRCTTESHYTFANGYQVPNGRVVSSNFLGVNYDEKLQGQNSKEFDAFRHNSPATKIERNIILFGLGKHACPGRYFAITLIKMILHHVMLKYNVKTEFENVVPRNHIGFFIGPTKPGESGIVLENSD